MIEDNTNEASLKSYCTANIQTAEISALLELFLKNQQETNDNVHSLQKAVAGLREQLQDFRVEHVEDNTETKRQLSELRKNKAWISREEGIY